MYFMDVDPDYFPDGAARELKLYYYEPWKAVKTCAKRAFECVGAIEIDPNGKKPMTEEQKKRIEKSKAVAVVRLRKLQTEKMVRII